MPLRLQTVESQDISTFFVFSLVLLKLITYGKQWFISFFSVASDANLFWKNFLVTYLKTQE